MPIREFEGHKPRLGARVYVDETAVVIGDVTVGDDASIWPTVVSRGDIESIRIGERTNIQDGSVLHVTHDSEYFPGGHGLIVGNDVTVGHRVVLHGCIVADLCLIGMGSVILDGARIESEAMVGAGSVVTPGTVVEGGYLWLGSPARRIRPLKDKERAYLSYSAHHYMELKDRHLGRG